MEFPIGDFYFSHFKTSTVFIAKGGIFTRANRKYDVHNEKCVRCAVDQFDDFGESC